MRLCYFAGGRSLALDAASCVGCGRCVEVCPHAVFAIDAAPPGERARARIADREACMECGACARNCPFGAIRVTAGVGCAAAVIGGFLKGTAPDCGCGCGYADGVKGPRCC